MGLVSQTHIHLACFVSLTTLNDREYQMPIPGLVSGAIMASSSSKTPQMGQIALSVESALYQWLSVQQIVGVSVGTAGVGTAGGSLLVTPNSPLMEGAFKSNGIVGIYAPVLWVPIVMGISQAYAFTGASPIVGVGSYTGAFVGDPVLLMQLLIAHMTMNGILGAERVRLCNALAQGINSHFLSGKVFGSVVGPPSSVPMTGQPIIGKFI